MIDWLDGDLAIFDDATGDILRTHPRPKTMGRAEYRYTCQKAIEYQDWEKAHGEWNKLPNEKKKILNTKVQMEFQNFMDIREGLLATLSEYRGFIDVKAEFMNVIKTVEFK